MAQNQALIAFKKLFGKPHTSPNKELLQNEALNTGTSVSVESVFGESVTSSPSTSLYWNDGIVERVRLVAAPIIGSDTALGIHGFQFSLPSDYETNSTNPKKGTEVFINGQNLEETRGLLQIVPQSLGGSNYQEELFNTLGSVIPPLDAREWISYSFGGIIYQETPPATTSENPGYLDCWIYIGKMASDTTNLDFITDVITLTALDISNKSVSLSEMAVSGSESLLVGGAPNVVKGDDWIVSGGNTLSWDGLGLEGFLETGEVIEISYTKQP